jgi:hypothetical protein
MANHSDDCAYCGADLRALGSTHSSPCPSSKIDNLTNQLIFRTDLAEWDRKKIRSEIQQLKEEYGK